MTPSSSHGHQAVSVDEFSTATDADSRVRWAALLGLTVVSFLLLLDDTAVAVALPEIQRQFGLGLSGQEWVVNAYTLTLAALTLPAGRLADRDGRRRVFLCGLAIFTVASLALGLAVGGPMLIVGRVAQGVGAALVAPASLAIIADLFPRGRRGAAIGVWAGVSASALGFGPLFGAIIADNAGWRWIFLLNVPLGVAAWVLGRTVLPESRALETASSMDMIGTIAWAAALLSLMFGLHEGNRVGWTAPGTVGLFVLGAVSVALFLAHEAKTEAPLLDLDLFRNRRFAGANVLILLATSVMCSLFFFLALYLQTVLGYSALEAGIGLLPLTATVVVVGPLAGRLADRIGARLPVTLGMMVLSAGLLGLSRLGVDTDLGSLIPWLALAGLGIGLITAPTTAVALGSTGAAEHGMAAGVFNTFRTTGLTLGIAIMGAILASFGPAEFSRALNSSHHAAFVAGFSRALILNVIIALGAAVLAAGTLEAPAPAPSRPPLTSKRTGGRLPG